jgi:hypothetical protein
MRDALNTIMGLLTGGSCDAEALLDRQQAAV